MDGNWLALAFASMKTDRDERKKYAESDWTEDGQPPIGRMEFDQWCKPVV